jgi:hypothetical protein
MESNRKRRTNKVTYAYYYEERYHAMAIKKENLRTVEGYEYLC